MNKKQKKKKFLLITYYFPPAPLGHGQRVGKLCKYLPFVTNWLPTIICGELPIDMLPDIDKKLENDIPENIDIFRIKSFRSSRFVFYSRKIKLYKLISAFRKLYNIPDAFGDWASRVFEFAIKKYPGGNGFNCIFVSGPPNSVYLTGMRLAKKWRIPFIIDMRDPWSRSFLERKIKIPWNSKKVENLKKEIFLSAKVIIANTEGNALDLKRMYPSISKKIVVIPNGYDLDDISTKKGPTLRTKAESEDIIHFLFLGGIHGYIPGGGIFEAPFFETISAYLNEYSEEWQKIKIHFVGAKTSELLPLLKKYGLQHISYIHGLLPINNISRPLMDADIYISVMPINEGEDKGCIPSKNYYYLAGGKYIYAIVPDGSAKDLLKKLGSRVYIADPKNIDKAKQVLKKIISTARKSPLVFSTDNIPHHIKRYDRKEIAKKIGSVLDYVTTKNQ